MITQLSHLYIMMFSTVILLYVALSTIGTKFIDTQA